MFRCELKDVLSLINQWTYIEVYFENRKIYSGYANEGNTKRIRDKRHYKVVNIDSGSITEVDYGTSTFPIIQIYLADSPYE